MWHLLTLARPVWAVIDRWPRRGRTTRGLIWVENKTIDVPFKFATFWHYPRQNNNKKNWRTPRHHLPAPIALFPWTRHERSSPAGSLCLLEYQVKRLFIRPVLMRRLFNCSPLIILLIHRGLNDCNLMNAEPSCHHKMTQYPFWCCGTILQYPSILALLFTRVSWSRLTFAWHI